VLELRELTLHPPGATEETPPILHELSARFPVNGHFVAVLGPSGCGKSTLLKTIAGLRESDDGTVFWEGRDLAVHGDLDPQEIGYVPQFSVVYPALTVWESLLVASRLRVAGLSGEEREAALHRVLSEVGLEDIVDRRVEVLSGGQRRRLALALELVAEPRLLLCDEVTSGLDPKAEDEIAHLLHRLSRQAQRLVVSVTHSLRHLSLCDSVLVLYQGRVAYHGPPETMYHYFGVERHEDLFPLLTTRQPEQWHSSWQKHRAAYYEQAGWPESPAPPVEAAPAEATSESEPEAKAPAPARTPWALTQFFVLLKRRWLLLVRDRGQLILHLALLLGFPCLVVIFALEGLPQVVSLSAPAGANVLQQAQSEFAAISARISTGSLASGLIMFQVILLALMGANNAAREIAGERMILEKEKFAGLSALAYVASKAVFLGGLVLVQSAWMALFVHLIVHFPGDLVTQLWLLTGVNGALTFICLGISALLRTPEQASLVSIYLVGFQLPLSGAVLALPEALRGFVRPFIAAYWGWSGYIRSFDETRLYEAILSVTKTSISGVPLCFWVLACHVVVGLYAAWIGCHRAQWE
jgi:ABC-type multidrug transport system ATPase subunit